MKIEFLNYDLVVCKVSSMADIKAQGEFFSVTNTGEEISVICEKKYLDFDYIEANMDWSMFRVVGNLDFSLVGIISKISAILAENKISIFVLSTYNTDYVLIKKECIKDAKRLLSNNGYLVE